MMALVELGGINPAAAAPRFASASPPAAVELSGGNVLRWLLAALILTLAGGVIVLADKRRSRSRS